MSALALILAGALLLRLAVALCNVGFIAIDDYDVYISRFIPVQRTTYDDIVRAAIIRSPFPNVAFKRLAEWGYRLGCETPLAQLRFLCVVAGLVSMLSVWLAYKSFELVGRKREGLMAAALVGFGFMNPLFSTRIMIEAVAAPFLALSAYLAMRYWIKGERWAIVASLVALALASMFRFQCGICAAALLGCVLWRRDGRGLISFTAAGAALFGLTGWVDFLLRGEFHGSLKYYVRFNVEHAAEYYGSGPVYLFALLFVAVSLPPTFFARYRGLKWREKFGPFAPALAYFACFLVSHSLFKHKEERFMITILPEFWILLAPLAAWFWWEAPGQRWRMKYFWALNGLLLVPASFNVPQNNIIGAVEFIDRHPGIVDAVSVDTSVTIVFPGAFIRRPFEKPKSVAIPQVAADVAALKSSGRDVCGRVYFARRDFAAEVPWADFGYAEVAEFSPGLLELAAVKLNPRKNRRRDAVLAFAPKDCVF